MKCPACGFASDDARARDSALYRQPTTNQVLICPACNQPAAVTALGLLRPLSPGEREQFDKVEAEQAQLRARAQWLGVEPHTHNPKASSAPVSTPVYNVTRKGRSN